MLGCDGVWDVISDQEAINLCHENEDVDRISAALINESMRRVSRDNISTTVVQLKND